MLPHLRFDVPSVFEIGADVETSICTLVPLCVFSKEWLQ